MPEALLVPRAVDAASARPRIDNFLFFFDWTRLLAGFFFGGGDYGPVESVRRVRVR